MERTKIVERDEFTYEEKQLIAVKSNERCCHCGKKVYYDGYGATVDHYIPLSKGGTNRDINMVMLCEDCNKKKGSMIIHPEDYLKYLNKNSLESLKGYFDSYINSFEYISRKNLLSCDAYMIKVAPFIKGGHFTHKAATKMPYQELWFKRADNNDRFKLTAYYKDYLKRYNADTYLDSAEQQIDFWLRFGCLYYLEKNGEIKTMIAATIRTLNEEVQYDNIERSLQLFLFSKYANTQSAFLAWSIQQKLAYTFTDEQGFSLMTVVLSIYKDDPLSYKLSNYLTRGKGGGVQEFGMFMSNYIVYGDAKEEYEVDDAEKENLKRFLSEFADVTEAAEEWAEREYNKPAAWMLETIKDKERDFSVITPSRDEIKLGRKLR